MPLLMKRSSERVQAPHNLFEKSRLRGVGRFGAAARSASIARTSSFICPLAVRSVADFSTAPEETGLIVSFLIRPHQALRYFG